MRMFLLLLPLLPTAAACGGRAVGPPGGPVDAAVGDAGRDTAEPPDDGPLTDAEFVAACDDLRRQWHEVVDALDLGCTRDLDCAFVGGSRQSDGNACGCVSWVPGGCGLTANRARYEASAGPALDDEYRAAGCPYRSPSACDCGVSTSGCVEGRCLTTDWGGCF
ncbi:MAG TPA: hypothetical protein VGQ83_19715 [Polyangia bacterium]|jgi:hypothetical protein